MASFSDHAGPATFVAQGPPPAEQLPAHRVAAGLFAGGLAAALIVRHGLDGRGLIAALLALVLVAVSVVDLEERRIPNRIVLPATAAMLLGQLALNPGRSPEFFLASIGAALFLFLPRVAHPAGLGLGDVKLALLLGAALGRAVIPAMTLAVFALFLFAVAILITRGATARRTGIPFGPFLALGALVVLFV
jgi:leader peptidase (prepilin peptidase) / N-methyltransferase